MIAWLIIPENAALISWVAFVVGGISVLLTLAGLWIAIKQLGAIKTEAEAQKLAIEAVQLKVASFDTAQECQIARSLIGDIQGKLRERDWPEVLLSYESLIQSFLRLSHSNSSLPLEDRALLVKMTKDMANMCEGIRKKSLEPGHHLVLRGQDQALRDFSDIMTKVTFSVVKDIQK